MSTVPMQETPFRSSQDLRWWQKLAAAGFTSAIGAQVALNLYVYNAKEFWGGPEGLARSLLLCLALWAVLFAALQWGRALGRGFWMVATAYGAFLLVRDFAFPLPLHEIDGDHPLPSPTTGYLVAEILTFVGAVCLLWLMRPKTAVNLAGIGTVVFSVFSLGTAAQHRDLWQQPSEKSYKLPTMSMPAPKPGGKNLPNVYHILFDEYSTIEHRYQRQEKGIAPFDDFICYADNISNYNRTWLSVPSFFTGVDYTADQKSKVWFRSFQTEGLLKSLKQNGYAIQLYGFHRHWWQSPHADYVRCTSQIIAEHNNKRKAPDFLGLLELRALPSYLGASCYDNSQETRINDCPPPGDWPYYCTLKFREMVANLSRTPAQGNYMFIHMILPHGPCVMDENVQYVGKEKGTRMGQINCAEKLLAEFIAELKRLGRYDDALIIVHGDTADYSATDLSTQSVRNGALRGAGRKVTEAEWMDGARWPLETVMARAAAGLVIKPPRHQGYRVDHCPAQLKDLPPTILGVANLVDPEHQYGDGCDLLNATPGPERVRKTYVLGKKIGGRLVRHLQEYRVANGVFEPLGTIPIDCD